MAGRVRSFGLLAVGLGVTVLGLASAGSADPKPANKKIAAPTAAATAKPETKADFPADKARRALERTVNLDFKNTPLHQVVEYLAKLSGLPIVLDSTAGAGPGDDGQDLPAITFKAEHLKLGSALHSMLQPEQLGYAVVGGQVLIANPAVVLERQLGQPVAVHSKDTPLGEAFRQLRGQTGANLVLDRRGEGGGQTKLTVDMDDVPLETAVRLLAAEANLELIRTANVLFVTTPAGATRLRQELTAPAATGLPCGGALGALGLAGGGGFGGGGLMGGPGVGALGIGGGGALGLGGSFGGGACFGGGAFGIGGGQPGGAAPRGGQPPQPAKPAQQPQDNRKSIDRQTLTAFVAPAGDAKQQAAKPKPAQPKAAAEYPGAVTRTQGLREKLAQPVRVDFPPGSTLRDALDFLTDLYGMRSRIILDSQAFKDDPQSPVQEVGATPVNLPKMTDVPLRSVLRLLLEPVHGSFVLRDGLLVVTTAYVVESGAVLKQPVDVVIRNETLGEALQKLSALSGANIVLDSRITDEANKPVSAALAGVPVDTAVRLVADMAGLRPVRVQNVLYVTKAENARRLEADERRRKEETPEPRPGPAAGADAGKAATHVASNGKAGR